MSTRSARRPERLTPPLRALADPTRLKMLWMLEARERTVGDIGAFFDLAQPTITRHLQTLRSAGLVTRRRAGQRVFYGVDTERLGRLCLNLAACFPCCCATVSPASPPETAGTRGRSAQGSGRRPLRKAKKTAPRRSRAHPSKTRRRTK